MIPHCSFDLHLSKSEVEHLFYVSVGHLDVSFGEKSKSLP